VKPNILDLVPASWLIVTIGATFVAIVIFIRTARRWGVKWALGELAGSFFPPAN
jgi:hypothetical protein